MPRTVSAPTSPKSTARRRIMPVRWEVAPDPESSVVDELVRSLKISKPFGRLLVRRGLTTPQSADAFLSVRLDGLHDPMQLPDMEKAVSRIETAVREKQRVVLFGDYDADGVSSTALLESFFRVLGHSVEALVPERTDGGYGLSPEALARIEALEPDLLITLDNGIGAHDAISTLKSKGVDTIVLDHHHVSDAGIPDALAVVNPKRPDSDYPFDELCGAGLAFKLAWALSVDFSKSKKVNPQFKAFLLDALGLAAVGTLADVVPLVGENRIIAANGLKVLPKANAPGLSALMAVCKLKPGTAISATDVTFRIAPRINAAGRCGKAAEALELLLTKDRKRAQELADHLDDLNSERQQIEQKILGEAREQAISQFETDMPPAALILESPDWHVGVIGIVASRMVEEFHRPTILLAIDEEKGTATGSGRSISGFHLADALNAVGEHLVSHGGHAAAAGLTVDLETRNEFRLAFQDFAEQEIDPNDLEPSLEVEEVLSLNEISGGLCRDLDRLEPCGAGNPKPTLAAKEVDLAGQVRSMGSDEQHISFFARQSNTTLRTVGFGMGTHFNDLCEATDTGTIDIAFRPGLNTYRGTTSIELRLRAFRAHDNQEAVDEF